MSMTYNEMKDLILFHYHKTIDFWYKLVGKMFETTNSFTENGLIICNLNNTKMYLTWCNDNNTWELTSADNCTVYFVDKIGDVINYEK